MNGDGGAVATITGHHADRFKPKDAVLELLECLTILRENVDLITP
ncbi:MULTISPECIES: hypothetical protein [unclassified Acidiphilium]|nr:MULTISPECIES: hypothetical protein [unclassified Acidiphilium]